MLIQREQTARKCAVKIAEVKKGVSRVMKKEKIFMDVTEVAEVLDVSESYAYKLIRKMNVELKENGFITIGGKINRKFFEEHLYHKKAS